MGAVHEAVDEHRRERVALKIVSGGEDGSSGHRARLRFEAEALAKVTHSGVVRYLAHGADALAAWLALEWVEGDTLAERVARRPLSPMEAVACAARVARALEAAHAAKLVHRDVKPSNVILRGGSADSPVLVDFGIARAERTVLTATGSWIGTPRYIAPEQLQDARHVDGRADVFSLAAVLYELLVRSAAFPGDTTPEVLARVLFEHPPPLDEQLSDAPDALVALVDAGLTKEPQGRPTASAFAAGLEALADDVEALAGIRLRSVRPKRGPARMPVAERTVETDMGPRLASRVSAPRHTFGRAALLDALERSFSERSRVVAVWGAPGVGKSHLATAAASRVGSAVRVRLAGGRAEDLGRAVGEALGAVLTAAPAPTDVARWLARHGVGLVALDDLPTLAHELVDAIEDVRWYAPDVRWLAATATRPLDDRVVALEVPPLDAEDAAELLSALVADAGGRAPCRTTATLVARALDGLPGALAITAREIAAVGEAAVLARLDVEGPARAHTLHPLDNALTPLSARQRRVLAHAALFESGCTAALLEAALPPPDRAGLHGDLTALRDRGLLRPDDDTRDGGGLRVLATIRPSAWRFLTDAELDEAYVRHGETVLAAAIPHAARARSTGDPRAMSALAKLRNDALRAAERLGRGGPASVTMAVGLAAAIAPLLLGRGDAQALARLVRALEGVSVASEDDRRTLRILAARADAARGDWSSALAALSEAAAEDGRDAGELLLDTGVVLHGLRRHEEALAAYEQAAERLARLGDLVGEARAWGNLGALAHDRGDATIAEAHYRRAAQTLELIGEERLRGTVLGNLAVLVQERGDVPVARALYAEAIELLSRAGDVRLEGIVRGNAGMLEHEQGRLDAAVRAHEAARALLERTGDVRSEALALGRLAAALADDGAVSDAQRLVAEGLRLAVRQDDRLLVPFFHLVSAFCHRARASAGDPSARVSAADALLRATSRVEPGGESLLERCDDARTLHRIFMRSDGAS